MTHTSPALELDRPLSSEEDTVVGWLLAHGGGDNSVYLDQLQVARVAGSCGCGCASIDFSINGRRPKTSEMTVLSDYQWHDSSGNLFGAFVFARDGLLAGLDLWSIDGQATPTAMPPIGSLVPIRIS